MRQVILDTETTGLEPAQGHRIIEIGCVELLNRRVTNNTFHQYLNPEREVEDGAYDVHGLSNDFLSTKPLFGDIAGDFINFINGSELIIHNAPFDVAFINAELNRLGDKWGRLEDHCHIIDTLKMAREMHPGQKNSLDALCSRYEVDNSDRDLHGALLDARILLEVYLAMTGGQTSMSLEEETGNTGPDGVVSPLDRERLHLVVSRPTQEDLEAHRKFLQQMETTAGVTSIWRKLETEKGK